MEQSRKEVLNVPKQFGKHGEEGIVPKDKYSTRTYSARAFVLEDPEKEGIRDADDLRALDFEIEGASIFETMGKIGNYFAQMFAQNMAVQVQHRMVAFYRDSLPDDVGEAEEFLKDIVPASMMEDILEKGTIAEFHEQFKKNWDSVSVPVKHVMMLVSEIIQDMMESDNLLFWQEPELIMIGNPSILESIEMTGATIGDEADEGMEAVVSYLKNAMTQEEE